MHAPNNCAPPSRAATVLQLCTPHFHSKYKGNLGGKVPFSFAPLIWGFVGRRRKKGEGSRIPSPSRGGWGPGPPSPPPPLLAIGGKSWGIDPPLTIPGVWTPSHRSLPDHPPLESCWPTDGQRPSLFPEPGGFKARRKAQDCFSPGVCDGDEGRKQ